MPTPQEIYSSEYLRSRAEEAIKRSIIEYQANNQLFEASEFASAALSDAERAGCEDLEFLDYLYTKSQE